MSTPMFQQYAELKAAHPDAILFFRMGDFYETFYEDAKICHKVLEVTLTARHGSGESIPMAGVPHHAADGYIRGLTEAGYRVAIAEQMEPPTKGKKLVRREIVRVVTPGVVLDPTSLAAAEPNWLAAVVKGRRKQWGVALLDASTGALRLCNLPGVEQVLVELGRVEPKEIILSSGAGRDEALLAWVEASAVTLSEADRDAFRADEAVRELCELLGTTTLAGFSVAHDEPAVAAAGAAVRYAQDSMGRKLSNVHGLQVIRPGRFLGMNEAARRNLELFRTLRGGTRKGSLLDLLDHCETAMGSRLLKDWISSPLVDLAPIEARQQAIGALIAAVDERAGLREALAQVADMERLSARVAQGTAHARDLGLLRRSLLSLPEAMAPLRALKGLGPLVPTDLMDDLAAHLAAWLVDDLPMTITDGGMIRRGVDDELDDVIMAATEGRSWLTQLETREREATGITSLKVRSNKVFGYYIEVTRAHLHKVPSRYHRKQTLSNGERYITPELKELEEKVLGADEKRKRLEYGLFLQLRDAVQESSARIADLAHKLARLDVLASLAEVAELHRWTAPEVGEHAELVLTGSRHPVVEASLAGEPFVPNDVQLDAESRQLILITGPNMSGKSTLMRQVALIVLMAQMGAYVPADRAVVGLCDQIFTRVGASDDLARGQSTFMVEMAETAAILHHATERSLVILDEIGRGTSTYDGLSIAWAVAEDLVDRVGARTLFATHYHELCELADTRGKVINQSVAVNESGEQITFLRKLQDGGASRSYGIQCGRLAGLPRPVVKRAQSMLKHFEKHAPRNERHQLSLFGAAMVPETEAAQPDEAHHEAPDALRERLADVDPDVLTPRQALDVLYELRGLA